MSFKGCGFPIPIKYYMDTGKKDVSLYTAVQVTKH